MWSEQSFQNVTPLFEICSFSKHETSNKQDKLNKHEIFTIHGILNKNEMLNKHEISNKNFPMRDYHTVRRLKSFGDTISRSSWGNPSAFLWRPLGNFGRVRRGEEREAFVIELFGYAKGFLGEERGDPFVLVNDLRLSDRTVSGL